MIDTTVINGQDHKSTIRLLTPLKHWAKSEKSYYEEIDKPPQEVLSVQDDNCDVSMYVCYALRPFFEDILKQSLYCHRGFSIYYRTGGVASWHRDRQELHYSASWIIEMNGADYSDFKFRHSKNDINTISQRENEILLFKGCDTTHTRDHFLGDSMEVLVLFYSTDPDLQWDGHPEQDCLAMVERGKIILENRGLINV